jgi:hypothetical protein
VTATSLSGAAALAPYEALFEHIELELELIAAGDLDLLQALAPRWAEILESLPAEPPASAGPLLEHARLARERAHAELLQLRDALLDDLATTRRARRTASGYSGQVQKRPRLDRSA